MAFAFEVKDYPNDLKQRFDSSTTSFGVLHGRDMSGKVVIITGANCGIGYECSRALAMHGTHVIMACRDLAKAQDAIKKIKETRVCWPININMNCWHRTELPAS